MKTRSCSASRSSQSPRRRGRRPRAGITARVVLGVRLTPAERARLSEIAVKAGQSAADVVRGWIRQGATPDPSA